MTPGGGGGEGGHGGDTREDEVINQKGSFRAVFHIHLGLYRQFWDSSSSEVFG